MLLRRLDTLPVLSPEVSSGFPDYFQAPVVVDYEAEGSQQVLPSIGSQLVEGMPDGVAFAELAEMLDDNVGSTTAGPQLAGFRRDI